MRNQKSTSAFTMVELVVTILIVGILAAAASLTYSKYLDRVRLAEAQSTMDTLGKAEVTYYLTNKHFIEFRVPTETTLIPSSGAKIRVNAASGSTSYTSQWEALGKPLADGTMISFQYKSIAGKNDSAGNGPFNSPVSMGGGAVQNPNGLTLCESGSTMNCTWQQLGNRPDASALCMVATANLDNSSNDYWWAAMSTTAAACTMIFKSIFTDANGKISSSTPVNIWQYGH